MLAEVQAQAHRYQTELKSTPLCSGTQGIAYHYERSVLGIGSGIRDGVVSVSGNADPKVLLPHLAHIAQLWGATALGTFRIVGPSFTRPERWSLQTPSLIAAALVLALRRSGSHRDPGTVAP